MVGAANGGGRLAERAQAVPLEQADEAEEDGRGGERVAAGGVPAGDVDALSRALLGVIADEERRRALGAAALETSRRYDPETVGRDWVALLDDLVRSG